MAEYEGPVKFDLIDQQIAWAEAEEAKGDMSAWFQGGWARNDAPCGTAYCIAGHALEQAGYVPEFGRYVHLSHWFRRGLEWVGPSATACVLFGIRAVRDRLEGSERERVFDRYVEDGIDEDEVEYDLFAMENGIADLKRIRDAYAVAEGVPTRYDGEY